MHDVVIALHAFHHHVELADVISISNACSYSGGADAADAASRLLLPDPPDSGAERRATCPVVGAGIRVRMHLPVTKRCGFSRTQRMSCVETPG